MSVTDHPLYAEVKAHVEASMALPSWPAALRELTALLDHDGIGGVTTEQIIQHVITTITKQKRTA